MRKPHSSFLLVGTVVLALALFVLCGVRYAEREPRYEGRPLSAWMMDLDEDSGPKTKKAEHAIQQLGANALPLIIRALDPRNTSSIKGAKEWFSENIVTIREVTPRQAMLACESLGAKATPAIPTLMQLLRDPSQDIEIRDQIPDTLISIGPASLPPMMGTLSTSNELTRFLVLSTLGGTSRSNAPLLIPVLLKSLKDTSPFCRAAAAQSLGHLAQDEDSCVPALTNLLTDSDSQARWVACRALGEFHERGRLAIPPLLTALEDPGRQVREMAATALAKIDPDNVSRKQMLSTLRAENLPSAKVPATIHAIKSPGIDNFFQLSPRFYSGAAPEGDAGFAQLQKLGVKTIITVDGAKPDADEARRFGIRYVHLPIGYNGVPANQALRLVKAAETLPGPIFVHCHHGMHRGPAGAAVVCMALEGWTPDQAVSWLRLAGASTNYPGLYRSVQHFQPPSSDILKKVSNDFPEKSAISPLADVMIEIDGRFDNLKLIKKSGYKTPPDHPDLDPAQETLLLDELFKELLRSPSVENRPPEFKSELAEAEKAAAAVHQSLATSLGSSAPDKAFQHLNDACAACHKAYRN